MKVLLEVEVEHRQGVFKSKDEVAEVVAELVDGTIDVDGSEYEIVSVSQVEEKKK